MWILELLELLLAVIGITADLTDADPKKRRDAWRACGIVFALLALGCIVILIVFAVRD